MSKINSAILSFTRALNLIRLDHPQVTDTAVTDQIIRVINEFQPKIDNPLEITNDFAMMTSTGNYIVRIAVLNYIYDSMNSDVVESEISAKWLNNILKNKKNIN